MAKIQNTATTAIANWKTTVLGIIGFVSVALVAAKAVLDNDPLTVPDWNTVVAAGSVAIALIVARDGNVSSETSGAK